MQVNEVVLSGELTQIEPMRYTPAGVPVISFRLLHRSEQVEAGIRRRVECELPGVALAEAASQMADLKVGETVRVDGFLNRRNRMSVQPVLHAVRIHH